MFFFFIMSKRNFKYISLIVILFLFIVWLFFLKIYLYEFVFLIVIGFKVIYKGDIVKK